jgi:hypothetical protein
MNTPSINLIIVMFQMHDTRHPLVSVAIHRGANGPVENMRAAPRRILSPMATLFYSWCMTCLQAESCHWKSLDGSLR